MEWVKKRWVWLVVIVAVFVIVGWKEKRCQSQAHQCRANYAQHLPDGLTVDQQASEQQAIAAACEPDSYFCRLFSAANLPSMLLVLIGVGGIYAAIKTLLVIERQTIAIEQQTKLQAVQWVALKNWRAEILQPRMLGIKVDIVNETDFPLTLEGIDFRVGTVTSSGTEDVTVVPQAGHSIGFIHRMLEEEYMNYLSDGTAFGIRGAIRFGGIAGRKVQPFGGLIAASFEGIRFESRSEYEASAKEHYGDKEPRN